jgi:ribosomal-protein-alanine N-acetyltransferase
MAMYAAFSELGTFNTQRLCIRQLQLSDAEAVFAFKSDHQVTDLYGQEPHRTVDDSRAWIQGRVNDYTVRDSVFWALSLKDEDVVIGECCLWNFQPDFLSAELGYELNSRYWHKGLMNEALTAVLSYGFREMGLHRIEACPFASNIHSQGLLIKLGFKLEGILRERHQFHGHYLDQLYYGLLSREWSDRTNSI